MYDQITDVASIDVGQCPLMWEWDFGHIENQHKGNQIARPKSR